MLILVDEENFAEQTSESIIPWNGVLKMKRRDIVIGDKTSNMRFEHPIQWKKKKEIFPDNFREYAKSRNRYLLSSLK